MTAEIPDSLRREIGQRFVFGFHGVDVSPSVLSLIQEYYVGAFIIMKRNVQDAKQLRTLVAKLQLAAREAGHARPLLIGIDQENGVVSAFSRETPLGGTQFPGAMALASTNDPVLVEKVYSGCAREMRLCGINWDYAPVCDINIEPKNPVIGVRSFGDDPSKVTKFATAAANGLAAEGVAPSLKHFPGHGDTHVDSHLGLPRIMKTMDELRSTELVPFTSLIKAGVATIMTGHMALPLVTGDEKPCSLSRAITTGLLREELGYDGVIVTDCLEMDAVVKTYGSEGGAVEALKAGADIAMLCHRIDRQVGAIKAVYNAFSSGELSIEGLKLSEDRIRKLKERFVGLWDDVVIHDLDIQVYEELRGANRLVQREAYLRSVVVLEDRNHILPISKAPGSAPIVLFTPMTQSINSAVDDPESFIRTADGVLRNTAGPSYLRFADAISKAFPTRLVRHVVYGPNESVRPRDLSGAATVIFATRQAEQSTWQLEYLRSLVRTLDSEQSIIVLATLTPYELLSFVAGLDAVYMCTFEHTTEALRAAVSVISGESPPRGVLPVKPSVSDNTQH